MKSGYSIPFKLPTSAQIPVSPPDKFIEANVAFSGILFIVESMSDIAINSSRSSTRIAPNFFNTASKDASEPERLPV